MEGQQLAFSSDNQNVAFTMRDFVIMAFRRRRPMVLCFFGILLGTLAVALFWPSYKAESEILVRRDRVDPVVTPEQNSQMVVSNEITEEELNSEVELIKSQDVLQQVVKETGLDRKPGPVASMLGDTDPAKMRERAVDHLRNSLGVDALPKTDMIRITYKSRNPELAAGVLRSLDAAYLQKHQDVHRSSGQLEFFTQQVEQAKAQLQGSEDRLKAFPVQTGSVNPTLSRDITLQKLNDLNVGLGQTRTAIAETQQQIAALEQLARTTPQRLTTTMREQDDAPVLQQMEGTLLQLQLKRSDMASKYQPDYPPLQELNREIAATTAAIAKERPLDDRTTDQNPAYSWINSELVKDKAALQGYQARAAEIEALISQTFTKAKQLDAAGIQQQDLLRTSKAAEDNYLLYLRKREEARISDALDRRRILNVAIAESPIAPRLPAQSPWALGFIGFLLASTASMGLVFTMEYFDPLLHTATEIENALNVPVLAAIPLSANTLPDQQH